jgi:hypothetical protein
MGFHGLLRGWFHFLYADDVRTPQETHLWPSTACYEDGFTFYMQMMFVPHRKHICGLSRPDNEDGFTFYMQMMFVPHSKHTYGPPRPVTRI